MFRPHCRAIFRLIFKQMECTVDSDFNLGDLVLQELVKIIVACYIFGPKHVAGIICLTFIHLVVCLTTGSKPLPKQALHIVRSRASSLK